MIEQRGSFFAVDGEGRRHKVLIYVDVKEVRTLDGSTQKDGRPFLQLEDGTHVNQIEKGKYETAGAIVDFTLTSNDPSAP
jgi:hypothetical protein